MGFPMDVLQVVGIARAFIHSVGQCIMQVE